MIIYCTNDLLSAHTKKRCSYFEYYGIEYQLLGICNLTNQDSPQNFESKYTTENRGITRYFLRLYYATRIIFEVRKKKDCIVIYRGIEFLFGISILKPNCYFELTDIPNVFFKSRVLMRMLAYLCSKTLILSTSPAYLELLKLNGNLIWHNVPSLNFDVTREVDLTAPNNRVIYAGYLRGIKTLVSEYQWLYPYVDFFGKRNILNSSVEILGDNYFGEYFFDHLDKIYNNYIFGYVSDFHGPNSGYNLTNRIYEVIFNGCIPVHVKRDSVSNYFNELGIFYISSKEQFEYARTMDSYRLKTLINSNHQILRESVLRDFSKLNLHLT